MNIAVTSKFGIDGSRNHQIIDNDDDDSDDKQGKNYVGAFWCHYCNIPRKNANDMIFLLQEGFKITKTMRR
jgi:hypothetical protein